MTSDSGLDRLAALAGVEPDYWDIWGNHHPVGEAAKRDILAALGFPADNDATTAAAIAALEEAAWRRMLPPVVVVHAEETITVPVCLPRARLLSRIDYEVIEEAGARHSLEFAPDTAALTEERTVNGEARAIVTLPLPVPLPLGYHTLRMTGFADGHTRIIVAPRSCYLPRVLAEGHQVWGVAAQLYTLRRPGNWGIGDFTDLLAAVDACARSGADLLGLNPLHALFPQHPEWASPYSPASRLFLNPLYIDPEAIPEFATCPEAQTLFRHAGDELQALRDRRYVDYTAVAQFKLKVLYALFEWFRRHGRSDGQARHADFSRYCSEEGEPLRRFALFNTLAEHFPGTRWQQWPEPFRNPNSPEAAQFGREHAARVEFFMYVQWNADRQLAAAQARALASGMAIGLYADLAVGGARESADAWAGPETLVQTAKVGCPPDPFNMLGQDWQIPPLHPHRLRELAYEPFIAILRANMRHAGALRIDHAMGMLHLFWIPGDGTPAGGAYVKYPFEDLLAVLALESHRNRCLVVGEDLGTVPDGFRERMAQANVLSYRVLYFEKAGGRYKRPDEYPPLSLACISTHDLATLWGYWQGADIELKQQLAQYPSAQALQDEQQARVHDRYLLLQALADEGLLPAGRDPDNVDGAPMDAELAAALHAYLARSPARILLVQIDDLMQEGEQINLPGTIDERPNWRRKLGGPVEGLPDLPTMKALRAALLARRQAKAPPPEAPSGG
jgi:4-alpha-glucanotransferase